MSEKHILVQYHTKIQIWKEKYESRTLVKREYKNISVEGI